MKFELTHEVDKGPIPRWIANKALKFTSYINKKAFKYADMYTAVWDDYDDYDDLYVPHNQMTFEGLEDE